MIADPANYKLTGAQRLAGYKPCFDPATQTDAAAINDFINIFCEYQLADNNYMDIHLDASRQAGNMDWFDNLQLEQVLRFITYIIWTDKFVEGYLLSKVKDKTIFHLLARLEDITNALILSSARK